MPFDYHIDPVRGLVTVTFRDVVTVREIGRYRDQLRADPAFSPTMDSLADFSDVKEFRPRAPDMNTIVSDDPFAPESHHAAVAPSDVIFGMLRMYEFKAHRSEAHSHVCRTLEEAHAWLDSRSGSREV